MPIKTNLKSLTPRRQLYKQEITLISHGYTNPTAWPGGKLTVYPWDNTIDQWILENLRKLDKQELVLGLLKQCCDLNGGSPDDFVSDEINTVLLVSRALTTDGMVTYTTKCPYCGDQKQETIKVPADLEKIGEKTDDYKGFDVYTLPVCQDVVEMRPLLVRDERIIINRPDAEKKNIPDSELRTIMRVVTIGSGKPDTLDEIVKWFRALHPKDAQAFEEQGRKITPQLNPNVPHICDDAACGKKFTFPLTFDREFFR